MYVGLLKFFSTAYNFEYQGPKSWARPWSGVGELRAGEPARRLGSFFLISEFVGRPSILIVYGSHYMDFGL